jgi:hypothetical protein
MNLKTIITSLKKLLINYQIKSYERKLEGINFRLTWFNPEYKSDVKTQLTDQKWILESKINKLKNLK